MAYNEQLKKLQEAQYELARKSGHDPDKLPDGFPRDPGYYSALFQENTVAEAQQRFNNFLKRMYTRETFELMQQSLVTYPGFAAILVSYKL